MSGMNMSYEVFKKTFPVRIVYLIVSPIGILGNLFAIRFLLREKIRGMTKIFLITISVFDTAWLILYIAINSLFVDMDHKNAIETVYRSYVLLTLLILVNRNCSNITLLAVCIERVICVVKPHHVDKILTKKAAYVVVVVIILITCFSVTPIAFEITDSIVINPETNQSMLVLTYTSFRNDNESFYRGTYIFLFIFHFCLPVFGVVICNVWLVIILLKRRRPVRNLATNGATSHRSSHESRELKTTKLVLAVTVVFVLCVSPLGVYLPLRGFADIPVSNDQYSILLQVSIILETIHFSANSFVYFLGSSNFRKEISETIRKLCICIPSTPRRNVPLKTENTRCPETTSVNKTTQNIFQTNHRSSGKTGNFNEDNGEGNKTGEVTT